MSTAPEPPGRPEGCAGLVLAAGAGRRMGRPKALVRLGGRLLVERAARTLTDGGCTPVLVVLGAGADEVRHAADLAEVDVVDNPAWESGQSTSLRVGLVALSSRTAAPPPAAVLVSVVDQPGMTAAVAARLISTWRNTRATVVQATYDGRPRNPVLFDGSVLDELAAAVDGDEGARSWLAERRRSAPDSVVAVECSDIGAPDDVDTPADLDCYSTVHDSTVHDSNPANRTGSDLLAASGRANRSAR
jgi:nicotine blue oxidoreductase